MSDVLLNISPMEALLRRLVTRARLHLQPLLASLRDRLRERPLRRHPTRRRREIQLEFHWKTKF
jgi:hypothetical protein